MPPRNQRDWSTSVFVMSRNGDVMIVAWRYGYVPDIVSQVEHPITELEYDMATKCVEGHGLHFCYILKRHGPRG